MYVMRAYSVEGAMRVHSHSIEVLVISVIILEKHTQTTPAQVDMQTDDWAGAMPRLS